MKFKKVTIYDKYDVNGDVYALYDNNDIKANDKVAILRYQEVENEKDIIFMATVYSVSKEEYTNKCLLECNGEIISKIDLSKRERQKEISILLYKQDNLFDKKFKKYKEIRELIKNTSILDIFINANKEEAKKLDTLKKEYYKIQIELDKLLNKLEDL